MSQRILVLSLLLSLPVCSQEALEKPSPFPEKNRRREAVAASNRTRRSSLRSGGPTRPHAGVAVSGDAARAAACGGMGKACFFASRVGPGLAASGEAVNPDEFVAAHATYALGSFVRVTNLANGNTLEVRIVDRFPDSRRIISVSEASARELGFYEEGTADVKVDPVLQEVAHSRR
jgi:rare lipoprotein A